MVGAVASVGQGQPRLSCAGWIKIKYLVSGNYKAYFAAFVLRPTRSTEFLPPVISESVHSWLLRRQTFASYKSQNCPPPVTDSIVSELCLSHHLLPKDL